MRNRLPARSTAPRTRATSWSTCSIGSRSATSPFARKASSSFPPRRRLPALIRRVASSNETLFPVVDGQGRLSGIFTLRDLRLALVGSEWGPLVLADDLATRPVLSVTPEDTLHTALRRMTELNLDEIPVVQPEDSSHLLGLLSRSELTQAYTALIQSLRSPGPDQSGKA